MLAEIAVPMLVWQGRHSLMVAFGHHRGQGAPSELRINDHVPRW
jgi:hypothetical protein